MLGLALGSVPGFSLATFHRALGVQFLVDVAEAANSTPLSLSQDTPAALVLAEKPLVTEDAVFVTQNDLPRHRQGGNRVVLTQTALSHESNIGVFREVMARSYPDQANGALSLEKIAEIIFEDVLSDLEVREDLLRCLTEVLTSLRDLYQKSSMKFSEPWNVLWLAHVDAGIANLLELDFSWTESQVHRALYSCFGLPAPNASGARYSSNSIGKTFSAAINKWWTNPHFVSESSKFLSQRNKDGKTSSTLAHSSFSDLESIFRANFEAPIYFFQWLMRCWSNDERWVLSETDFLSPRYQGSSAKGTLTFEGKSLRLPSSGSSNIFMVSCNSTGDNGVSPALEIRIPVASDASHLREDQTRIDVVPRTESVRWSGESASFGESELVLKGVFDFDMIAEQASDFEAKIFDVDIKIPESDALVGLIPDTVTIRCVQIIDQEGRVYFFDGQKKPKVINTILATEDGETRTLESSPSTIGLLIRDKSPQVDRHKPEPSNLPGWCSSLLTMPQHLEISTRSGYITLQRSGGQNSHQSPLIAAAYGESLAVEPPSRSNQMSIRGKFEDLISSVISDEKMLNSNFHFMVSEDVKFQQPSAEYFRGFITDAQTFQSLRSQDSFDLRGEFLESPEVQNFQNAYSQLGVAEALAEFGAYEKPWPSKTSWRHLFENKKSGLEGYLSSYSELVKFARREGNPLEIFWASYPFSFSVWDLSRESSHCSAVLLSPLHPIRLAWFAAVEASLWEADNASQFLGTVEGWNFPFFGPGPNSSAPYFAVQSDTGDDQLFLGWSMLVSTEASSYSAPTSPRSIAGTSGLGTSPTGFNASTAKSALSAFKKLTPHLTSVVIDLARQTEAPRISEVDNAVVDVMRRWAVDTDYYPGGMHILDSNKRVGDPPLEAVAKLLESESAPMLSWRRYEAKPAESVLSNLRLLQDPGLQVLIEAGGGSNGYVDRIPLKRFSADSESLRDQNISVISPSIEDGIGWQVFTEALRSIEGSESFPKIQAKLNRKLLSDGNSDWVITGENFIAPSTISKLLSESISESSGQMLWEWQPPVLDKDGSEINRRPFFSVAKIPQALVVEIQKLLEQIDKNLSSEIAGDVLRLLGSRGVGLATLLASGGSHTLGALGFYLAFNLLDKVQSSEATRYVIPIDSAKVFLDNLAADPASKNDKRADLLEILVKDDSIQLRPVEIKFYGLGSTRSTNTLPDAGDSNLREAKAQAKKSLEQLATICANHLEASDKPQSANAALWRNALANLLEAAGKLSPLSDPTALGRVLSGILAGTTSLKVATPLVLYFQHGTKTKQGEDFAVFDSKMLVDGSDVNVVVSETAFTFQNLSMENSKFVTEVGNLLGFEDSVPSIDHPQVQPPEETSSEPQRPEAQTDAVPDKNETSPLKEISRLDTEKDLGVQFKIGTSLQDGSEVNFWPSNTGLTHMNLGVVGNLGTGKTQFIKSLISQLWNESARVQSKPISFLIFDYKRDYSDTAFLESVDGQAFPAHRIPINVFEIYGEVNRPAAYRKATSFISTISKIYGNIGPKQQQQLSSVIVDLFLRPVDRPPTMDEVYQSYISRVKEPDSIVGILDRFVQQEIFDDSSASTVPFEEFLGTRVSVLSLSELGNDNQTKNALVTVMLDLYYDQMTRTAKEPFFGENQKLRKLSSFLLVDEASMIMRHDFEVLTQLLLQGREFGFGVILASQYLSHFKTANTDYAENLLTWMIHQVPNLSAGQLTKLGMTADKASLASKISSLEPHKGLWHSLGHTGLVRGTPFFEL